MQHTYRANLKDRQTVKGTIQYSESKCKETPALVLIYQASLNQVLPDDWLKVNQFKGSWHDIYMLQTIGAYKLLTHSDSPSE